MRLPVLGAAALLTHLASAYRDASPLFILSTSELYTSSVSSSQLSKSALVTKSIESALSKCPSNLYIIVSQSGVQSTDYADPELMPTLSRRIESPHKFGIRSTASVAEVVGEINIQSIGRVLQEQCGAQITDVDMATGSIPATYDILPIVLNVYFPALSWDRAAELRLNDAYLASILDIIPTQNYTIIYTTTTKKNSKIVPSIETSEYETEMVDQEAIHMGLKRDLSTRQVKQDNYTETHRPLFEQYEFLNQGIFMCYFVGFILLSLAYVGISALASLQVTYAAFEKETRQSSTKMSQ